MGDFILPEMRRQCWLALCENAEHPINRGIDWEFEILRQPDRAVGLKKQLTLRCSINPICLDVLFDCQRKSFLKIVVMPRAGKDPSLRFGHYWGLSGPLVARIALCTWMLAKRSLDFVVMISAEHVVYHVIGKIMATENYSESLLVYYISCIV